MNKGILTSKSTKESDEYYTPAYAVRPLIKYIKQFAEDHSINPVTIWCPFDKEDSKYVQILSTIPNAKIIHSHIDEEKDFFSFEPQEDYDLIISNPPSSCKDAVLKRLFELDKPYAMLLPVPTLQGQKRFPYMKDIQYLGFDKRINYYRGSFESKDFLSAATPYGSAYFCRKFLPKDLIIEELIKE